MSAKSTRSNTNLKETFIDSLALTFRKEKQKEFNMADNETDDVDLGLAKEGNNVAEEQDEQKKRMSGYDLNDQHVFSVDKQPDLIIQEKIHRMVKFDGYGEPEQWLKCLLEKLDHYEVKMLENNNLVSDLLAGEALIWYVKKQDDMPTFTSFMKQLMRSFGSSKSNLPLPSTTTSEKRETRSTDFDDQTSVFNALRNQLLMNRLDKLHKFTGKSKQNVSKWLKEFEQAPEIVKLSEEEKLFFVTTCLEGDARDWFFDNQRTFSSWSEFTQKLLRTFESTGKTDIAFNRLRHYQQAIHQDVRQYYFDIIKLCQETNAKMDDMSKLQYLKDGLKPSLRFDVLLKDPKSPAEFLEYAQKVEQLKSLDERQQGVDTSSDRTRARSPQMQGRNFNIDLEPAKPNMSYASDDYGSGYYGNNHAHNNSLAWNVPRTGNQVQFDTGRPRPPYQCYKCGSVDHFIQNCPHNKTTTGGASTTGNQGQFNNGTPRSPYRCYQCGGTDHFIRNCPHFQ